MKRNDLPRGVFAKGRWFYLVTAEGPKRIWTKLSLIKDGLPALYVALATAKAQASVTNMPALIAEWQLEVMPAHADATQKADRIYCQAIAEAFTEFAPADVETPDCSAFLAQYKAMPRTFNAHRSMLRELLRFAEEKGLRPAGSNPVQAIKTMRTPARDRYVTDSELRRIKVAAMRWTVKSNEKDHDTRSGPMLCALIDMAYLTGQAIGDLLELEWRQIGKDGISFARAKVAKSTGGKVLIEWSPKLQDVVRRLKALRQERRAFGSQVFVTQDGTPYTYWGASSAWRRAVNRAKVAPCHFHDLRAKALTDTEARAGMQAARRMGTHSTEQQTSDYVRHRKPQKTGATR